MEQCLLVSAPLQGTSNMLLYFASVNLLWQCSERPQRSDCHWKVVFGCREALLGRRAHQEGSLGRGNWWISGEHCCLCSLCTCLVKAQLCQWCLWCRTAPRFAEVPLAGSFPTMFGSCHSQGSRWGLCSLIHMTFGTELVQKELMGFWNRNQGFQYCKTL